MTEVVGGELDLALGRLHVLASTGDDEHGLLAAYRRLDVRVGLGAQRLDLAALAADDFGHVLGARHRHALGDVLAAEGRRRRRRQRCASRR